MTPKEKFAKMVQDIGELDVTVLASNEPYPTKSRCCDHMVASSDGFAEADVVFSCGKTIAGKFSATVARPSGTWSVQIEPIRHVKALQRNRPSLEKKFLTRAK